MNENENEVVVNPNEDYLEIIKEMKKNSVSKEDYDKLREENKKLLSSLVNGEDVEIDSAEEETQDDNKRSREEIIKSINEVNKTLFCEDNSMTNLECAEKIIQWHDDMIELTGNDPFENTGDKFIASDSDKTSPKRTYEYLKNCVEQSQGDPTAFNVAFQAGLRQILPIGGKKK